MSDPGCTTGEYLFSQDSTSVSGVAEAEDSLGSCLTAGDFDGDGRADLLAGLYGESVSYQTGAGAFQVMYGDSSSLLTSTGNQFWSQDTSGIGGMAEEQDHLSSHLVSSGVYRLPYKDGVSVKITRDYLEHDGFGELDMIGTPRGPAYTVVAAADGVVMAVVDSNTETGADKDNNYIWIAHPNGEWTKYTHIDTGTALVSEGDTVAAGDPIGIEGEIGRASGVHVHFEVAYPDDPSSKSTALNSGGWVIGESVVPRICGTTGGFGFSDETYNAGPC